MALLQIGYSRAIALAEHLIAVGQTEIYLYGDAAEDFPYDKVVRAEAGNSFRLSGPSSCALIAEDAGLVFRLSVDFEGHDANGRGVSLFDRDRLRGLMLKLPVAAREAFADLLEREVLKGLSERTNEIRQALREQSDSEDCVRGLIAYARAEQVSA